MNNKKTMKTILFAALLLAMILPFSVMGVADAAPNQNANDKAKDKSKSNNGKSDKTKDKGKSDHDLFKEADKLEKKYKDHFKYDKEGKNKSGQSNDHKRHQDIVEELNSRGIFHKSQDQQLMMATIETSSSSSQTVDVFLMSPQISDIETMNSVCCGNSHNKKLSIKSGLEWNSPTFPWWEYRVESSWSSFTPTSTTKTVTLGGEEVNVRPYVTVKADHAVTHADFQVGSEVKIMDQNRKLVSLGLNTGHYSGIYFPYNWSTETGMFQSESYLSRGSTHTTEIQIQSIS